MFQYLRLKYFTAFDDIEFDFVPGLNVLIGENSTGKTHLMKFLYCAQSSLQPKGSNLDEKLGNVFLPTGRDIDRLVTRISGKRRCEFAFTISNREFTGGFTNRKARNFKISGRVDDIGVPIYIPVKEMLANAPGFRSLYSRFDIHFEEIYYDIIDRAFIPILKGKPDAGRQRLMRELEAVMDGHVTQENETFYLKSKAGNLELTLVAEGYRKLALLWLLIRNGSLLNGSTLFWDEPETNLNPKTMPTLVAILRGLADLGVQVFIATHSYDFLKELTLQEAESGQRVPARFISLYRDGDGRIARETADRFDQLGHNAIADQQNALFDRDVRLSLRAG